MKKKYIFTSVILCVLILAGCAKSSSSNIEGSYIQTVSSEAQVEFSPPAQEPETNPSPFPPLIPMSLDNLDGTSESWWVGTDVNEKNQPLHCFEMQTKYLDMGMITLGPEEDAVYITFDFGYETGFSKQILDTLDKKKAKGNFFLVLDYLEKEPDTVKRMVENGHGVGSHSITHPGGPGGVPALPQEEQIKEITAVGDKLKQDYDYSCHLFRFPEGIYSEKSIELAAQQGYYSIFWGFAYKDWEPENQPNPEESLKKALDAAHPGAIYLLHPQKTNADILGRLIDGLREKGYEPKAL